MCKDRALSAQYCPEHHCNEQLYEHDRRIVNEEFWSVHIKKYTTLDPAQLLCFMEHLGHTVWANTVFFEEVTRRDTLAQDDLVLEQSFLLTFSE